MSNNVSTKQLSDQFDDLIGRYFELIYTNDVNLFDHVFQKNARLYGLADGQPVVWSADEYKERLASRVSPAAAGAPQETEVLSIDFASPTQAFAKVKVRINQNIFIDYLTALELDGGWRVVSKTYHRFATLDLTQ